MKTTLFLFIKNCQQKFKIITKTYRSQMIREQGIDAKNLPSIQHLQRRAKNWSMKLKRERDEEQLYLYLQNFLVYRIF